MIYFRETPIDWPRSLVYLIVDISRLCYQVLTANESKKNLIRNYLLKVLFANGEGHIWTEAVELCVESNINKSIINIVKYSI